MAGKTIKMNLFDPDSVSKAIKRIEKYRNNLTKKCERFCRRLAEEGVQVAKASLSEGKSEDYQPSTKISYEIDTNGNLVSAKIKAEGPYILFIEFGSGIRYSDTKNPKAAELGYGPGTYLSNVPQQNPPYDNWESPTGWYYYDENKKLHHTFGVRAKMPMYNASESIRKKVEAVAKEVFG